MIQKNKIGIIGCGWLGFPLAKLLLNKNYLIKGSSTSKEKLLELENNKIDPYYIKINDKGITGDINSFLEEIDILIINIPPKIKSLPTENYSKKIQLLANKAEKRLIDKIIFISSTSVYGSNQGKINSSTNPIPSSKNGIEILQSEKIISKNKNCTIIRFGGLIGNNRHPVHFLTKKSEVLNPKAPINLIHLEDCIQIIYSVIQKEVWGKICLGVSPYHPTREDYYNKKCEALGLKRINFVNDTTINKEVTDSKILTELNYSFIQLNL
tara:strand:- start:389 stop:1192 length:804 start_codon:yes stop_codon:yes gene_type:complete